MRTKPLLMALLLGIAQPSFAAWSTEWWQLKPYVGIDAQERRMDFKGGFGDNLFQHNSPQGNIYIGTRLNSYVGLEAGFESTTTRTRTATLTTGDLAAGQPITSAASPVVFKSKAKIKGPHVDIMGFYKMHENTPIELIGSIGLSAFKGTFARRMLQYGQSIPSQSVRTLSKHKIVLRLAGGLQYMVDEQIGVRAMVGWVDTSKMVIPANDGLPGQYKPAIKPKTSTVFSLGLLWAF